MTLGLDALIGFVSSTALVMNLGSFLLPVEYRGIFSTVISLRNANDPTQNLNIDFHGQCSLDGEAVSCGDTLLAVYQASLGGYESDDDLATVQSLLKMLRPLCASYTIFCGLLLVACYGLLTFEWTRLEEVECENCQQKIVRGHKHFAIFCMGVATLSGLVATAIGLYVSFSLSTKLGGSVYDQHVGSTWILCLLITFGFLYGTVWLAMSDTASLMPAEVEGTIALSNEETGELSEKAFFERRDTIHSIQWLPPMA